MLCFQMTTKAQAAANAQIQAVLALMPVEKVDAMIPDDDAEFQKIADAILAWNTLLMLSGIVRRNAKTYEVLGAAMVALGSIVKYTYALGMRRGERARELKRRKRK